jgi:tRNA A-37 threonylcarbamoyl transferase component Bud32
MEYLEGENLTCAIKRIAKSKSDAGEKNDLETLKSVGGILAKVHSLNVGLGDTKPENIIVDPNGQVFLLDFEQASQGSDKSWDIAELLYYSGHYVSPLVGTRPAELVAQAFINGYVAGGGNPEVVRKAGNPKYTKVFSIFTLPNVVLAVANICRKTKKD